MYDGLYMDPKPPKLLKNKFVLIGIIAAILIVVLLVFLYIDIQGTLARLTPVVNVVGPIRLNASVVGDGIATYNYATRLAAYATLGYAVTNATQANISLSVYQKDPLFHIYLVDSGAACYSCFAEPSLYSSLFTNLESAGLLQNASTFQGINLDNLNATPNNSLIILSTGLMPASLLPSTGVQATPGVANVTLATLLRKGDYILYVGQNFSQILGQSGQIYLSPRSTISNLSRIGILALQSSTPSRSQLNFTTPTFILYNGNYSGAVASVSSLNGSFVALSNYPTSIWKNVSLEASDLTKVIVSRFWIKLLAAGESNFSIASIKPVNTELNIYTLNTTMNSTPYSSELINSSYSLLHVRVSNKVSSLTQEFPISIKFNPAGSLSMPPVIGYENQVQITSKVNRPSSHTSFSVNLYNTSMEFVNANSLGFFNTSLPIVSSYSFGNVKVGAYYLASLIDINDNKYSQAIFYVPYLNVSPYSYNFKNGTFAFTVSSDGQTLSGPTYSITLNCAYNESGTIHNGIIKYAPTGVIRKYGEQYFNINIGNNVYTIREYHAAPAAIPSIYIEFGAAALVIVLLNFILRAPNVEEYYIDVSSLPPSQKVSVTLSGDTIVNLFDTINYHFHWRYMPLTSEEIKTGISSNIRSGNTPISITLQNTNEVLYKLAGQGKLAYQDEYYIPQKWLETSKHDMEYLIIFRKLRDFLVEHAIFFTDLDQSTEADTIITVKNKQIPVFIYSTGSGMKTAPLHKGVKTFIIMVNDEAREELQGKLYNTYGKKSSTLRLAIESNNLEITDVDHLDALLY